MRIRSPLSRRLDEGDQIVLMMMNTELIGANVVFAVGVCKYAICYEWQSWTFSLRSNVHFFCFGVKSNVNFPRGENTWEVVRVILTGQLPTCLEWNVGWVNFFTPFRCQELILEDVDLLFKESMLKRLQISQIISQQVLLLWLRLFILLFLQLL